jgi:NAD(P)-dependent dehydrogenase (short-subunit alcohol dehydrogenase family)
MTMPIEYAAIKSAVIHLTKYMAKYLKGSHIRVNSLSPGGILDQQPEAFLTAYKKLCSDKGMLDPADVTSALLFLTSDMSLYVNGRNLIIDDGFSI